MRQLRQLELMDLGAHDAGLTAQEDRAAFSSLAQLESLRLRWDYGIGLLLPHLVHASTLRSLIITGGAQSPTTVERCGSVVPSRELLRQLLTASQMLEMRLAVGAIIEKWRDCFLSIVVDRPLHRSASSCMSSGSSCSA